MRSECRNRVSFTFLLSVFMAAVVLLSGCTNPEKAKAEHLAKADAYLKDSKFQEATIEYRNALQIDDKLAAAHWGLARAYEGLQRFQEAFEELKKTVELDPNNLEARVNLGNYYLTAARGRAEVIAEAEKLAKDILQKDPNHIEGHILLGSVYFAQGDKNKAFEELNRAVNLDPKRVESYLSLARFYQATNDTAKAEETYKRAIEVNSSSGLAYSEYGKFLAQANRPAEAEAYLKKAVEIEPSNRNSRFMLASFYLVNKQFDKAEVEYKALAALDPEKPESQAVLADFYSSVNRLDEAVSLYQAIIAKSPEYRPARYRLGEILLMKGDVQGATAQVNEVLKAEQTDRQALMLRARIRMQSGRDDEIKAAVEDLKEVLKQEPDSRPALYFIAQANYNLGLIDQARSFAGDLERKFPDYLPAKLLQVQLSISIGDSKTAINLASKLLETLDKTSPDRDNTPQMLTELRLKALLARGTAQAQAKNFAAAQQDFNAARSLAPNSIDPLINLAALAKAQGKPQDSIGFYENALSMDSTNVPALSGLIDAYLASKESDKAMARVDQILASNPNNPSLHFLKAQIYGVQQNSQGAEAELRKVLELDPNYISAYSALGALFVNTHQEDRAIGEYQKILQLRPDNATAYVLIGMLEDARKNYSQAADNYKKALERDPNAVIAANNLAWLYATRKELNGNLDEAVRLAQGVVQKYPNVPGFVDTLGWVYYNKGLHAAAVDQLQKAVAADEQMAQNNGGTASPTYHYHLGAALKAKGDKTGAKKEFEIALRNAEKVPFPDQEDARRALAEL